MTMRLNEWWQRTKFSPVSTAGLGWGSEYWVCDPDAYEGADQIRDRLRSLGRKADRKTVAHILSNDLLSDVLVAAGGVEHSVVSFRQAVQEAQAFYDEWAPTAPAGPPFGIAHSSTAAAWYQFANVISWTRAVDERLERRPVKRKLPKQGLLPALQPKRLNRRVRKLVDDARSGPLAETRYLANFTLHAALVRHPNSGAEVGADGKVRLLLPDELAAPVFHWQALTWDDHRDGVEFVGELWSAVQNLIDALLEAFEKAVPKRMRR